MKINAQNEADFLTQIQKGNYIVIFYSKWFKHSESILDSLNCLAKKYSRVRFRAIEMDEFEEVAISCDVSGMINIFFYINGKKQYHYIGISKLKIKICVSEFCRNQSLSNPGLTGLLILD
jgi:thiol-disulfide isomerase/thioredoxin